jgi:hypothetical protein
MEVIIHGTKYDVHPKSPMIGDIIRCTDVKRYLRDSGGYQVETIGIKELYGTPYGCFNARGVNQGGLYHFNVDEYELLTSKES